MSDMDKDDETPDPETDTLPAEGPPELNIEEAPKSSGNTRLPSNPTSQRKRFWMPEVLDKRFDGYTYRQIAEALADKGVDVSESTVHRWVNDALEKRQAQREEMADQIRQLHLEELMKTRQRLREAYEDVCQAIEKQRASPDYVTPDNELIKEKRQLAKEFRKTSESKRKLLGVDAPKKHEVEVETSVEYDVQPPQPVDTDEEDETLEAEVTRIETEEEDNVET